MEVDVFVCRKNIDHYRNLLEVTIAEIQRREIIRLLAVEEAKLKQLTLVKAGGAQNLRRKT
jgi:hypothetical protein